MGQLREGDYFTVEASAEAVYRISIGMDGTVEYLNLELREQDCAR